MSGSFTQDMNRWKQGDASAQFDTAGAHPLFGGVLTAVVAFGPS